MPRKAKRVTLAGPDGTRVRRGHEDATPERLLRARAGGEAAVDRAGVRRIGDGFDALRSRNLLDRLDVVVNETLWHAGERLRRHWHGAGYDGLSSIDLSRPSVDGWLDRRTGAERGRSAASRRVAPGRSGGRPPTDALPARQRRRRSARWRSCGSSRQTRAMPAPPRRWRSSACGKACIGLCDLWRMRPNDRPLPLAAWRSEVADADGG